MPTTRKILFLLPYPLGQAPSQRFRVEAFFPTLQQAQFSFSVQTFLDQNGWNVLYRKGSFLGKCIAVLKGFLRRFLMVAFTAWRYDYVFIHREATPLGPPIIEWILAKILQKKIIYDFDDAIWISNTSVENRMVAWLKACWKVKYICKWSYKVVGGNKYLCDFAKAHNNSIIKVPTTVDVVQRHNLVKQHHHKRLVIGWTGSHSTLHYLKEIEPVIFELQKEFDFDFLVISNKPPSLNIENMTFLPWNSYTEVDDLLKIDVGIMPLKHDAWSEGKCGFKLIQYLALGIPAVASDVGVNNKIIMHNASGFLANSEQEWYQSLKRLLIDINLRQTMGQCGREKILNEFSLQSQQKTFLSLFS